MRSFWTQKKETAIYKKMESKIKSWTNKETNAILKEKNTKRLGVPYIIIENFDQIKKGVYFECDNFTNSAFIPGLIADGSKKDLIIIEFYTGHKVDDKLTKNEIIKIEKVLIENKVKNCLIYIEYIGLYGISNKELSLLQNVFRLHNYPLFITNVWTYGISKHSKNYFEEKFDFIYHFNNDNSSYLVGKLFPYTN